MLASGERARYEALAPDLSKMTGKLVSMMAEAYDIEKDLPLRDTIAARDRHGVDGHAIARAISAALSSRWSLPIEQHGPLGFRRFFGVSNVNVECGASVQLLKLLD